MKLLQFLAFSFVFLLSGCCLDCTNSKADFESLQAQLAALNQVKNDAEWIQKQVDFYDQKAVQERTNESAVMLTRVCDYLIPVCERELVEPGRQLIAQYGTRYDSPATVKNQIFKLVFMGSLILASLLMLVAAWWVVVRPSKQKLDAARQLVRDAENQAIAIEGRARQRANEWEERLQSSRIEEEERLLILRAEANGVEARAEETKSKLIEMEMRHRELGNDINRLQKIRDNLNGSF